MSINYLKFTVGARFHRWTIIEKDSTKAYYVNCKCDCGKIKSVRYACIKNGTSKSCGCLAAELSSVRQKATATGKKARTRGTMEYFKCSTWGNIQRRCVNTGKKIAERNKSYIRKNIKLLITKEDFYTWCDLNKEIIMDFYKNKETPSIDRIDNDGNYELKNIRVISKSENTKLMLQDSLVDVIRRLSESKFKPIFLIHPNGKEEKFKSIKAACKAYNLGHSHIGSVIKGKRTHHKGFKARLVKEEQK